MAVDLRRIFEGLPAQILVLAPDSPRFTILAASDAYLQATLTEREAILGKGFFEVFPDNPDDSETRAVSAATASFQRVVDERCTDAMGIRRHDVRRSAADGGGFAQRYWQPVNSPLLGDDGRVEGIIHQVQDVTDVVLEQREGAELRAAMIALRGAEEKLDRSHALLRSSMEGQRDTLIHCIDRDYRYVYFNQAHRASMKSVYDVDIEVGENALGCISDAGDRLVAKESYDRALAGESHRNVRVFGDLERAYYEGFFNPMLDSRGEIIGATALVRDITLHELAEQALRESEERFRLLHDTMLQGVVYQDAHGTVISMNPAAERILGKRPEDFLGSSSVGVEHDTLREDGSPFPGLEHPAMVALRTGEPVPDVLMRVYNPREAHYRLISIRAMPLFRPGEDEPYRVYTLFDDVTERRCAEEVLRESEASARRAERRYRNLFGSMIEGFCTIEMVFDAAGRPVDYRFLEVNSAFEQQTGLHEAQGRLVRDLVPDLDAHWFEILGRVATTGEAARLEAPAAALGRFYDVSAFRIGGPDSGQVAILFNDISQRKRLEDEKDLLLEAAGSLTESILLPDVLDRLARIILDVGGHGRVVISLWQEELGCLTVARSCGDTALPDGMSVSIDDLSVPAQRSIEKRETFLIDYDDLEPGRRGMGDRFTSHLALWVPLLFGGRFVGLLATDDPGERRDFSERQIRIIEGIAAQAAVAIENARAYEAETAAQMKQAAQEERTRLARDLHDSITQALFAAALKAEVLTQDDAIHAGSAATAADVRRLTRGALAQMRTLLLELRAESLEDVPIEQLLRNAVEATEGRTSIAVGFKLLGAGETPRNLHTAIYRVSQEALNNVVRHSGASHASVELLVEPARVRLLVQDDGCGFRPGPESPAHLGLRSMGERAAEVGAALRVVSAPGEGTLITLDWRDGDTPTAGRRPSTALHLDAPGSGYPLE